jgi:hypothetical protein
LSDKEKVSDAYKKFAEDLDEIEEKDKEKRKKVLQKGVLDLEQKYRDEIKGTHVVDDRLVKLRKEAGMPELIGIGDKVKRSRFKDKNKFDQFLAKEVLEVGLEESSDYGGVIVFDDFCRVFAETRPNWEAPKKEIKKALESLAESGLIPKLSKLKSKGFLITFKPAELESDVLTILSIASVNGLTSYEEVATLTGWQKERIEIALVSLVDQEIAYIDKKDKTYFFPSMKK